MMSDFVMQEKRKQGHYLNREFSLEIKIRPRISFCTQYLSKLRQVRIRMIKTMRMTHARHVSGGEEMRNVRKLSRKPRKEAATWKA
jgi:hypothetical protein